MALGRKNGNQMVRDDIFTDVRNMEVYSAKDIAKLVLRANDYQLSAFLLVLEHGHRQTRRVCGGILRR